MRILLPFLTLALMFSTPVAGTNTILLENAIIVDPSAETLTRGYLLIRDGRISSIEVSAPAGYEGPRLDLRGRWVIPGLVDMHTHSFGNSPPAGPPQFLGTPGTARRMLYCGVTAFLDLFNMEGVILNLRDRQRTSGVAGADIFAAGPCLTATKGHCSEYGIPTRIIDSPDDARKQISELAKRKPDVVKIVYDNAPGRLPTVDLPTLKEAVSEARRNGVKTVVHIGTWQDVREAAEAGANAFTHIPRGEIPPDLPGILRERRVHSIPTLGVQTGLAYLVDNPKALENSLLASTTTEMLLESYRKTDSFNNRMNRWVEAQRTHREEYLRSVKRLSEEGVLLMVGTDAGNAGVFQGFSAHRELELMVDAGLSNWAALRAATTVPAGFLGKEWGVSPGSEANLVVIGGSPIESISNTQKIVQVIHHGKVIDRTSLLIN